MRKLDYPLYDFEDVLNACASGMGQVNVRNDFRSTIPLFIDLGLQYEQLLENGELHNFPKIENLKRKTVVIPPLTKGKLVNLYENNLRNKEKPARRIYESLLASANEKCPFCGDIGHPKNLDHFLPLAHYPQFSVLPVNLIPACRDCNMGEKGDDFADQAEDQIIHPFLDKEIFYNQQWVFARYINDGGGVVEYYVQPPAEWQEVDKSRVSKHFHDFDLGRRYGIEAGKHLSELIDQRNSFYNVMGRKVPLEELTEDLVDVLFAPLIEGGTFANHWKKVMYGALSTSQEFLVP
ncbi:HNH endonuclease [Vreelandella sp. EE7]